MNDWLKGGGQQGDLKTLITLEGDGTLPRHPILDFSLTEKKIFVQCFGEPLLSPKDFVHISGRDYIGQMEERRDFMRDVIAMTKHSRYVGLHPPKPKRRRK